MNVQRMNKAELVEHITTVYHEKGILAGWAVHPSKWSRADLDSTHKGLGKCPNDEGND